MVRNIINTFFTRIFASAANLLIAIIISNVYGAAVKGEQGLILTTITLVTLLTAIIGSGSLIYLTPRMNTKHLLGPSYLWNFLVCCLVFVILRQTEILPEEFIIHTIILTFILTLTHIHTGLLIGTEKIKQSNLAFLLNNVIVLLSLLVFVFVIRIKTVYAYIYSLYIGYIAHLIVSIIMVTAGWRSTFGKIQVEKSTFLEGIKNLLRYGFLNQLDVIAQMMSFRLSYYFISYYISKSAVGIYSNAISIVESLWLVSRSIAMVQNARIANSSDMNYSVSITVNLLKVSFILVLLAVFVLVLIPAGFYQFIFGDEFGDVRIVILFLSPGVLLFSASFILSSLFAGTGKYQYNTVASIVGLIVTVLLALVLIPRFGLIGAGMTASLSYMVTVGVKIYIFLTRYGLSAKDFMIRRSDFRYFVETLRDRNLS